MPTCPICTKPLETVRQREGVIYPCRLCDGRAATVSQICRVFGERIATKLLRVLKSGRCRGSRPCPFCSQPMHIINTEEPRLDLDACKGCNVVWFDGPSYELMPQLAIGGTNALAMQATEIIAMDHLQELKRREEEARKQAKRKKSARRNGESNPDGPRAGSA